MPDDFGVLTRAADKLDNNRAVWTIAPAVAEPLAAMFRQLAWMGRMDPDQLHRVGMNEAVKVARAVLGE